MADERYNGIPIEEPPATGQAPPLRPAPVISEIEIPERMKQPAVTVRVYRDGGRFCALYGENLQEGVAGFGDRASDAVLDFIYHWMDESGPIPNIELAYCEDSLLARVVYSLGRQLVQDDKEIKRQDEELEMAASVHEAWRQRAELLWQLLDDIDTLSDQLKPDTSQFSPRQSAFYVQTLDLAAKREEILVSNGQELFIPGTMPLEKPLSETEKKEE